jgi:MtrB/PioB family decaheme-associated outer membrane protein
MKSGKRNLSVKLITLAVQGSLAAMAVAPLAAMAQEEEPDVASLTNPTNTVEVGIGATTKDSNKFGEYNGLNKKGAYGVGNVDIRGGDSYGENLGISRWSVTGDDLGTTSRSLDANYSNQGQWNLGVGFDQLRHYTTTNYQTPYLGTMGGNNFVLPSNFGVVNTSRTNTGATGGTGSPNLLGGRSLTSTQLADFRNKDVYSQRENTKFSAGFVFSPSLNFKFGFNHLEQTGAKLIGSGTDPGAAVSGSFAGVSTWKGEVPVILMNPTKTRTETFDAAFNWTGSRGYATAAYFGSLFHDDYHGVTWSNPFQSTGNTGTFPGTTAAGLPTSTMSTPPSNQFHQLNLTGGYAFTPTTRLVGGYSYARNTQDSSFDGTYTPGFAINLPGNSLDGKVILTHADAKLTNQATRDLTLSAGLKYNERDNRTASNLYTYYDEGNKFREAWSIPMSNKKTQADLAADYRLTSSQKLHVAYEYEQVKRWCNNTPSFSQIDAALRATNGFGTTNIAAAEAYYANGTSCVQVPESTENRLVGDYRLHVSDTVGLNAGVAYGDRKADINTAFYNPMQSVTEGFENPGFVAFFDGSRREGMVKAGVDWQPRESLNFTATTKYRNDDYYDHTYGVGKGTATSLNLDASYAYSENNSVSAYATWQWRDRDLHTESGRIPVALTATSGTWSNKLKDDDTTLGVGAKQKGLFHSRLELAEDLTYSLAKSDYNTTVNYATTGCSAVVANNTSNQACGSPPSIKSTMWQFNMTGNYRMDKASAIIVGYRYQHLKSDDYYYNAYQYPNGFTSGLPTNQTAPNYSENLGYVAYQYSFR